MSKDFRRRLVVVMMALALLCGVLLLRFALLDADLQNWVPVSMPLPEAMGVSDVFHLSSGGKFSLQITTTAKRKLADPMATVPITLRVEITGEHGFRLVRQVSRLDVSPTSNETDTYTAVDPLMLPRGGDYSIRIVLDQAPEVFATGRGVIQLQRIAPAGYGMTYWLAEFAAYACFLYSLIQAAIAMMRRRDHVQST